MEHRPCSLRVAGQEFVPHVGMVHVGDEDPGQGEAQSEEERDSEGELPAIDERPVQAPGAQQPHQSPQGQHEDDVLHSHWEPLVVEGLVALASRARVREVQPPEDGEDAASVVGTDPMPRQDQGHSQVAVPLSRPLLQSVEPVRRIPAELVVVQQVEGGVVVSVVLHDHVDPWDGNEVCEGMGNVGLPVVGREGGTMSHIVEDVDILDAQHYQGSTNDASGPSKGQQLVLDHGPIQDDGQALQDEDQGVDVPHVHLLLWSDLREEECQVARHGFWDVGGGDGSLRGLAALVLVHI
mmetsp:Transcript_78358/g.171756  ORF Transcript_78358/g.171756 Transcript_78358/m.171756 type:complete len:295 (-) Transcript_78358:335-1219(-)